MINVLGFWVSSVQVLTIVDKIQLLQNFLNFPENFHSTLGLLYIYTEKNGYSTMGQPSYIYSVIISRYSTVISKIIKYAEIINLDITT